MKITIEGERPEDRNTPFHKKIVSMRHVPNTKGGNDCILECGHYVRMFGDPALAKGVALCMACRDAAGK